MTLGENIKFYRKQKKLTQNELANLSNMSRSYLADIERDRYNPSVETLKAIADALHIKLSSLMGEETTPPWATAKDKRDFKKMLEEDDDLMFDGVPIENEDRQRIKDVLTGLFWEAKQMNKRKKKNDSTNDTKK
ncbi:helix-turn-helix transcriptional regulator [Desulfosporosinus sp. BG]|uniref:helix-turn-helix domain-containing protein n=1 Tax=Desulfosporosinus sp. BG TaxID=1633135 RepID=UPI00083A363A|nr:helix-turn-helix transcriptional regulator [Desulfosporosinus sp. BG]ODA41058.1 transcriptional regulator, Cro/CI family [Desulfosporosinus sp. BG]